MESNIWCLSVPPSAPFSWYLKKKKLCLWYALRKQNHCFMCIQSVGVSALVRALKCSGTLSNGTLIHCCCRSRVPKSWTLWELKGCYLLLELQRLIKIDQLSTIKLICNYFDIRLIGLSHFYEKRQKLKFCVNIFLVSSLLCDSKLNIFELWTKRDI